MSSPSLEQAIQLIRSGDKKTGGKLLAEIVKQDPRNETAWLWLAGCFDNDEKKKFCLKKALEINPDNTKAWDALNKLTEDEIVFEDRLDLTLEKDAEESYRLMRGVTVFDTVSESPPAPVVPEEEHFQRSGSFTRVFFLGAVIVLGLLGLFLYVLISRGILFPPTPERVYAKAMRGVLTNYSTWNTSKAQFDAVLAGPYNGVLSPTGGTALSASDALFTYLALLSNPSDEVSSYTARIELANLLQASSQAAYQNGQAILLALDETEPPAAVRTAHQQFYECLQQETRRAMAVNQIVTSGVATGFTITSQACEALPTALATLQKFARDY